MTRFNKASLLSAAFIAALTTLSGCGSKEPQNVMEGVDQEAIQSYEEMVAADEAMMTQEEADAGDQ